MQAALLDAKQDGVDEEFLLTVEHPATYTVGKTGVDGDLLADSEALTREGIAVHHVDRGGAITYHGPGQLVAYPVMDLRCFGQDLHRYLRDLEEALIRTVGRFGIRAERIEGLTGIWVGDAKLAAIGIKTSRWISMHGVALNVTTDLTHFERIVPCGIRGKAVTSMEKLLARRISLREVGDGFIEEFSRLFSTFRVTVIHFPFSASPDSTTTILMHKNGYRGGTGARPSSPSGPCCPRCNQ